MVEKQWGESIENVLVFTGTKCGKPWWQWDWPRFESMWMTGGRTGGSSPLPHKCPCYQISQTILQPLLPLLLLQFSSVQSFSCVQLFDPMDCSTPGLPVHHQLLEFTQIHAHWASDAIQLSHPLSSPSPPALNLTQHQCLFKWVSSSYQVGKVLELQLQHQSIQWTSRTDLL